MATTTNSTLKGVLAFGALTIGAAMFFVGSEDSEGVLATAAQNADYESQDDTPETLGPRRKPAGPKPIVRPQVQSEAEVVEWDDEALIDNTDGFDPSPSNQGPDSARPTDDTVNDFDDDEADTEVRDRPMPQIGDLAPYE